MFIMPIFYNMAYMLFLSKCLQAAQENSIGLMTLSISTTIQNSIFVFCIFCLLCRKPNCPYVLSLKAVNTEKDTVNTSCVTTAAHIVEVYSCVLKNLILKDPSNKNTEVYELA